jgi:hypothetical protein
MTTGTPPDGHLFELPCTVINDKPSCAITTSQKWGTQYLCSQVCLSVCRRPSPPRLPSPTALPARPILQPLLLLSLSRLGVPLTYINLPNWQGSLCFLVATQDVDQVVFTTSAALAAHMDARSLKATILNVAVMEGNTHKIAHYEIANVQGFPEFQGRRDLEVCWDTLPVSAGKRCIQFYFGAPPYHLRMAVDGGAFLTNAVTRIMPYQRSRVVVRVRDLNMQDRVCIDYPATYNMISGVPGLMQDLDGKAFFEWEDAGECYAATRCLSGLVGASCVGREWERVFTIKAKAYNSTLTFGHDPQSMHVKSASTFSSYNDRSAEAARLTLNTILKVPAFADNVPGVGNVRGTPYSMQRLEPAFINCPLPTVAVYSLLQIWKNTTVGSTRIFSYRSSEPVDIQPEGALPGGIVLTRTQDIGLASYKASAAGNYLLEGRIAVMQIDWTPIKGQEGMDHVLCFKATGKLTKTSNTRCFVVPVVRCQYCTVEGDSLASLAIDYKTSWLQLWAANSVCVFMGVVFLCGRVVFFGGFGKWF